MARTPKAMSASLASAMIKLREPALALISASFWSRDLIMAPQLGFDLGQRLFEGAGRGLQAHQLLGPKLDLNLFEHSLPAYHAGHAQADIAQVVGALHQ